MKQPSPTTLEDYQERIQRAIYWLEANQDEPIEPADLAHVAAFSVYHFHRVFRGVTGESVMECLRRLRLERAARALRHTNQPVTQIALNAGYQSHEGFTRAFKSHFLLSPRAFRRAPVSERLAKLAPLVDPKELPQVTIKHTTKIPYLCVRHRRPFLEAPVAWEEFAQMMHTCDPKNFDQAQLVGRYFDDPDITPEEKQRFDVGMIYTPGQDVPRGCFVNHLPAGKWAVMIHKGPYHTLSQTYLKLIGHWFPHSSLEIGSHPCLEFYRNLPHNTAPSDLVTEVWAPVLTY